MIIVLQVDAPPYMVQGVKETLAMYLERYGDTKVIDVRPDETAQIEQMKIGG